MNAPTVAKYVHYSFDADAILIGADESYMKRELAVAAVRVAIRFPVPDNASVAKLLRDVADQIERGKAK